MSPLRALERPSAAVVSTRARLSRRSAIALLAVVAVIATAVALFASGAFGGGGGSAGASLDNGFATSTTAITRRSLSQQTQVSATLGYAAPSTIVAPAGTAPSDLAQAQQGVTSAQGQLATATAALSSDGAALTQEQATLSADKQKLAVDCAGDNAGAAASSGSPSSNGGDSSPSSGSSPCATDAQAVASDEQSVSEDTAKVATDRQSADSATSGLATAQTTLGQAQASATLYGQSSTYTSLPAIGQIVKRGQTLYEISGQPVVVLYGPVAPWRAFMSGMSPGRDVAELNENLDALGYGRGLSGDELTSGTVAAIDAFQSTRGLTQTGELLLGSVVFSSGPVRVTTVTPTLGATVQAGSVMTITSTVREVTIDLDAAQQSDLAVGDPVSITLPDNSTTPGKVSYVGTVATVPSSSGDQGGGGSSTPTIEVDVTPTDPAATGHLDQAPVNVSITTGSVKNALVVPVNALLALANGGYALEEVAAGGARQLVGVSLGLFDDQEGLVQVTGSGLAVGQRIVVPSE